MCSSSTAPNNDRLYGLWGECTMVGFAGGNRESNNHKKCRVAFSGREQKLHVSDVLLHITSRKSPISLYRNVSSKINDDCWGLCLLIVKFVCQLPLRAGLNRIVGWMLQEAKSESGVQRNINVSFQQLSHFTNGSITKGRWQHTDFTAWNVRFYPFCHACISCSMIYHKAKCLESTNKA